MAQLIKKTILKKLSRFTKNLALEQINWSTFKGEGELHNLELDEAVLTDLLELPSWLRLKSAFCNQATFRIQWTRLKSDPILLQLGEVEVEVETCEDLRSTTPQEDSALKETGKYGFQHKVIDGMTVTVERVVITFRSPAFVATVQMSRIVVESKSPSWKRGDLRLTRIKNMETGQLLTFKELEWQNVRIEAKSTQDATLTPLRLLTNQARCRIIIKKRLSDCFVMGSRLTLILDDLLWVLTDSQLKAALHFLNSLAGLVQKATEVTRKRKAARKIEVLPEYQAQISQQARQTTRQESDLSRLFSFYDVVETSYHFLAKRIDLHLSDDPGEGRSIHPQLRDGGALQICVENFQVDYYPYHLAIANRKHWARYRENSSPHTQWLQSSLQAFRNSFLDLIDGGRPPHTPLSRASGQEDSHSPSPLVTPTSQDVPKRSPSTSAVKLYVDTELKKLMTSCIILRVEDFKVYRVTTSVRRQIPKELISGDKERYSLPDGEITLHAEFTYYYYPGDSVFPVPPPKFYLHLNPIQIQLDILSVLWIKSFVLNLQNSLLQAPGLQAQAANGLPYIDVKMEAMMPRVVLESNSDYPNQRDRPKSMHVQATRLSITNVRNTEGGCSRAELAKCIHTFQIGSLFYGSDFPSKPDEFYVVVEKLLQHASGTDDVRAQPPNLSQYSIKGLSQVLYRELLWVESKDVWCVQLDPVWIDFFGARAVGTNRSTPFVDAFPLTIWVYMKDPLLKSSDDNQSRSDTLNTLDSHLYQDAASGANSGGFTDPLRCGGAESLGYGDVFAKVNANHIESANRRLSGSTLQDQCSDRSESGDKTPSAVSVPRTADVHALVHISGLVSVQLNHYQLLFLLRLAEDINEITMYRIYDSKKTPKSGGASSELSIVVGATLPLVEVTLLMPSLTPGKESSGGDLESVIPDSSSLGGSGGDRTSVYFQNVRENHVVHEMAEFNAPRKRITAMPSVGNGANSPIDEYFSDSDISITLRQKSAYATKLDNFSALGRSMLSRVTHSLDRSTRHSEDGGDTASIQSDDSVDSGKIVMEFSNGMEKMDAMFEVNVNNNANSLGTLSQRIEVGCEVLEEEPYNTVATTPSERGDSIDSSIKRRDLVSTVTFKLSEVEFVHQLEGFDSCMKLQLSNVTTEECAAIPWDEFQSKFSLRSRGWMEPSADVCGRACVQLRFDHKVREGEGSATSLDLSRAALQAKRFDEKIQVRVSDLSLRLNASTLSGINDLFEDEVIVMPIPTEITLDNVSLHVIEDQPSSNITWPGPNPVDVLIARLHIKRDRGGLFTIEPPECARPDESDQVQQLERNLGKLMSENEQLRRKLISYDILSRENLELRKSVEEVNILRSQLAFAQDKLTKLLEEKERLLGRISDLSHGVPRSNSTTSASSSSAKR